MATQVVKGHVTVAVPEERSDRLERVKDFFALVAETLGMYFTSAAPMEHLTPEHRAKLSTREKSEADSVLLNVGPR